MSPHIVIAKGCVALQPRINAAMRSILLDWLVEVHLDLMVRMLHHQICSFSVRLL